MNPNNPGNKGKWAAFAELGYDTQPLEGRKLGAQDIIRQLRTALGNTPAVAGKPSSHGCRFVVRLEIQGPNSKQATLVTCWQIDHTQTIPRLITNWLEVHK